MRCIEMALKQNGFHSAIRLIETWDVLKSEQKTGKVRAFPGLIETWDVLKLLQYTEIEV